MPRYRKLHTKTLESLDINDMPDDFTRLFWVLLPLIVCREGRGLNSATWLKAKLFPLREDVATEQVQAALDWCLGRGMLVAYEVDGRGYFYIPSFHKYQGNTLKEGESDYPPPQPPGETSSRVGPELVRSRSATDADAICNMQYSDADADADTGGAASLAPDPAVVVALESVEMGQIPAVLRETQLTAAEIIATVAYAKGKNLGAAWVRKQLRDNQAHRPRAPDNGRQSAITVCAKCSCYPCMCEEELE